LAGVVLYYFLTGEPKALECADRTAAGMLREWKRLYVTESYYEKRILGDMQAVGRAIFGYCAMYQLTGEKIWLDESLTLLRKCVLPKWKDAGPHLHRRNQIGGQDYAREDIKYCYSIQAFCFLHHLTGDKKLLELLKAGCDTEFPENYFDAPLFLADLNAYVALKTGEKDYLDEAVEHWISTFPESKCPPVYQPDNSQWTRRCAMLFRTGNLLQYAHWKKAGK